MSFLLEAFSFCYLRYGLLQEETGTNPDPTSIDQTTATMPSVLPLVLVGLLSSSAVIASTPVQPRNPVPMPGPAALGLEERVRGILLLRRSRC